MAHNGSLSGSLRAPQELLGAANTLSLTIAARANSESPGCCDKACLTLAALAALVSKLRLTYEVS